MDKLREPCHLILQRGTPMADKTRGALSCDGQTLCYTLEKPWDDNRKDVSCIPPGFYQWVRHGWDENTAFHMKRVWELLNVKDRQGVLMHAGNWVANTDGCVLVGKSIIADGIGRSQEAVDMLRDILPEKGTLEIRSGQ